MHWKMSKTAVTVLMVVLVSALTIVGTLEGIPTWLRGTLQAAGAISGIYLGTQLQLQDTRREAEASAKTAIQSLIALATNINGLLQGMHAFKSNMTESPPSSVEAYNQALSGYLVAADGHVRGILVHAQSAAQAWLLFLPSGDSFRRRLEGPDDLPGSNQEAGVADD